MAVPAAVKHTQASSTGVLSGHLLAAMLGVVGVAAWMCVAAWMVVAGCGCLGWSCFVVWLYHFFMVVAFAYVIVIFAALA